MFKMRVVVILGFAIAMCTKGSAAQSSPPGYQIKGGIGWHYPLEFLGVARQGGSYDLAYVRSSLALYAEVQKQTSRPWLDTRARLSYIPVSKLVASRLVGEVSCGDNCFKFVYEDDPLAGAQIVSLTGDALIYFARVLNARPYLVAGAGLKQYFFDQNALEESSYEGFSSDPTDLALHFGGGAVVGEGPLSFNVEIGTLISEYEGLREDDPSRSFPRRQRDLSASIGLRIAAF